MKKRVLKILIIMFLALVVCSCSLFSYGTNQSNTSVKPNSSTTELGANEKVEIKESTSVYTPSSIEEAVQKVYESVVAIYSSNASSKSSGSGVIIGEGEEYSYIITCHHVIEGYSNIQVALSDNSTYQAYLVGGDERSDIAVIKIQKTGLKVAAFIKDSSNVTIASTAIAIGNPLGTLSGSVTTGIISSTNRLIVTSDGISRDLIQTDAAINSGNSGGGLFNIYGELIGIVNAKYQATGVEGLGFAIPANTAKSIALGLIELGYVEGRYNLGVTFSDGYYRSGGWFSEATKVVYVSAIEQNSSTYGYLQIQDILVGINVTHKDGTTDTLNAFSVAQDVTNFFNSINLAVGDEIEFLVKRGSLTSDTVHVSVTVAQYIYTS